MSPAVHRPRHHRWLAAAVAGASLSGMAFSGPASAQEPVTCLPGQAASECQLPAWPEDALRTVPSPFGTVEGTTWLDDVTGDAPPGGLDILSVGIGSVDIADVVAVRTMDGLLANGRVKRAVRPGRNVLVRVVLDRPLDSIGDGHAGIHVATDIDRSRSNNAPAGVDAGQQPFAGSEDVYTVAYASTNGRTQLLDSDLSKGWYGGDDPFAAAWASPTVLDLLVRPEAMGDGLVVVTFSTATEGGYDGLALGSAPIPVDGQVGLRPACLEASIANEPFVVKRLVEGRQTLRDVEAPASWRGGASFPVSGAALEVLQSLVGRLDEDGDGVAALPSSVNLFEDGVVIGQRPDVRLRLDGDTAELALGASGSHGAAMTCCAHSSSLPRAMRRPTPGWLARLRPSSRSCHRSASAGRPASWQGRASVRVPRCSSPARIPRSRRRRLDQPAWTRSPRAPRDRRAREARRATGHRRTTRVSLTPPVKMVSHGGELMTEPCADGRPAS